ncbi:polysialyltransferase family glycosyltransferase [Pseudomonas putida]|uniref:polysialyltransferase family glycosyltransferase n=1 Tax=Pseudomonas putida TaxID=303 RepID=UPI0037CB9848
MKRKYLLVFGYTKLHLKILENITPVLSARGYIIVPFYESFFSFRYVARLSLVAKFFWFRILMLLGRDISVLLPHPQQLLANYFFYSSKVRDIFIYEDGLMNYIRVDVTGIVARQTSRKSMIAALLCYRFRRTKGYLSGCEQRIIRETFVRHPDLIFMPEMHGRITKFEFSIVRSKHLQPSIALFVDQDIEAIYSKDEAEVVREKLYSQMRDIEKVYFKPHHSYWTRGKSFDDLPPNFEMLSDELKLLTAEEVAASIGVGSVWGFFSSALVNISSMLPEVKCYSCVPESHVVKAKVGDMPMSDLLARFGVQKI